MNVSIVLRISLNYSLLFYFYGVQLWLGLSHNYHLDFSAKAASYKPETVAQHNDRDRIKCGCPRTRCWEQRDTGVFFWI